MLGLYIHIPFCGKKCFYCDFFSIKYDEQKASRYTDALSVDLKRYKNIKIDTVYIGGGTPSVLCEKQISKLMDVVNRNFDISALKEFTFELNPESASAGKLEILKKSGVDRLSMGLQSADDNILKRIGRLHDFEMFKKAYETAKNAGFDNFNIDLIYGLPGENADSWKKSLEKAVGFNCGHISLYPLSVEYGTAFCKSGIRTDDGMQREMFEVASSFLSDSGFVHYEISNWAKPGKESLHNSNYWRNFEYIASGAGASGYLNGERYKNTEDVEKYIEFIEKGLDVRSDIEKIDEDTHISEKIILGLRLLKEGVGIENFKTSQNIAALDKFLDMGMLLNDNGKIKLSENFIFTSNEIFMEFVK